MTVYKRPNSTVYQYSFFVDGRRYRGSTKTSKLQEARTRESALITETVERGSPSETRPRHIPVLREFAPRFLKWVESSKLEPSTKAYYERGWALLAPTKLAGNRMSHITGDDVEATPIRHKVKKGKETVTEECSAHYTNRALRTLKRMFSKAVEWLEVREQPKFKLAKAYGRDTKISTTAEKLLLSKVSEPIKNKRNARTRKDVHDVLIIAQDTGMRPSEIYRIRIENLDFENRQVWNPYGKTVKSRRFVPMSERMASVLAARCIKQQEGWVFPAARSKSGHITTIAKGFQTLRDRAGLSKKLVLYSARHTYGSYALASTGNLFAVAGSMGHVDLKCMEPYQHHDLASLRAAINLRNENPSPSVPQFGHILGHIDQNGSDGMLV
jgi:integrase